MSSAKGVIDEIFVEDGVTKARLDSNGKQTTVSLLLLRDARVGDEIIVGAGIALSLAEPKAKRRKDYVLSDSR
jgi:hydrogenase maturation factor